MRVHHLNCGTMCPLAGSLLVQPTLVCHCLLVETDASGLVLVDTGFGLADIGDPARIGPFRHLGRPAFDPGETAIRQVQALGFQTADVRHVVLTHLDLDHAGGLADFPDAKVHLLRAERDAAANPRTLSERARYKPVQWAHDPIWALYELAGEPWYGFDSVRDLEDLPPEILLIPLMGHSRGHTGVAVDTGNSWLLHAGDAYFYHGELESPRRCPPGLRALQSASEVSRRARFDNQRRLRRLVAAHGDAVTVFSAHDALEHGRLQAAAPVSPDPPSAPPTGR